MAVDEGYLILDPTRVRGTLCSSTDTFTKILNASVRNAPSLRLEVSPYLVTLSKVLRERATGLEDQSQSKSGLREVLPLTALTKYHK